MNQLENKLLVTLFSDSNFLAVNILESLLSKNCLVNIVTSDVKNWKNATGQIVNKNRFSILSKKEYDFKKNSNYTIFCGGFINKEKAYADFKSLAKLNSFDSSKTLVIFPFEIFDQKENSEIEVSDNLGIIYLGDLLGPRINLESDLLLPSLINEVLKERTMTLAVGEVIYPVFITDAVKNISKWLFSFGPYGKELFLLGPNTSGSTFWNFNQKIVHDIKIIYDEEIERRAVPRGFEVRNISCDLNFSLLETYRWVGKRGVTVKVKRVHKYPRFLNPLLMILGFILLFPFITLSICLGFFYLSYKDFVAGNDEALTNKVLISKTVSYTDERESQMLSYIPLLGRIYEETYFAGKMSERLSDLVVSGVPAVRTGSDLFNKILSNNVYDPKDDSQKLSVSIEALYQNVTLLELDVKEGDSKGLILAKKINSRIDIDRIRNVLLQGKTLVGSLPSILGKDQRKTYLVLFENNMELRPTGGFIGSYGLLTFDGGRMSDLTVSDVYSADGQLNGHVEPPAPIKNYLGEANWWMRDSNWDPDFPTSAQRAEWFLDKEVGRSVDGVLAVDLAPIQEILKYTGPIFLADYNLDITSSNLYEKTQEEVESDFFPGTHKKASFLTELSRDLISEVGKLDSSKKALILKSFYNGLEGRHVQVYLHDDVSQDPISSLNWDGEVLEPDCGQNCYPDFAGIVEANFGVNKANYFVSRKIDMNVTQTQNEVDRKMIVTLKNSANPALGLAGKYKVYLRFLIPAGAEITGSTFTPEITTEKGRQEVGALFEVLEGQTTQIGLSWKTPLNGQTGYGIYFRKQAGVTDDPLSLTLNGVNVYNTTLAKDIWIQKP